MIKFHSNKSKNTHWFTVNGKNSQVIATSETYTRKSSAKKAATRLIAVVINDRLPKMVVKGRSIDLLLKHSRVLRTAERRTR